MEGAFNIEKFISVLKVKESIWNYKSSGYNDRQQRYSTWLSICKEMIPNFEEKSKGEQSDAVMELQNKWKVLRDGFSRSYKNVKKNGSTSIKKYAFYNDLLFLKDLYDAKHNQNEDSNEEVVPAGKNTRRRRNRVAKESSPEEACIEIVSDEEPPEKNARKQTGYIPKELAPEDNIIEKVAQRMTERLNNSISIRQDETFPDGTLDVDRLFLMSLCKDFNAIPEKHKLDAKFDIINVLRYYRNMSSSQAEPRGSQSLQKFRHSSAAADKDALPTQPVTTTVSVAGSPNEDTTSDVKLEDDDDDDSDEEDSNAE